MPYTPPANNAVDLLLAGAYTPPANNAVDFNLGLTSGPGSHDDIIVTGRFALAGAVAVRHIGEATCTGRFAMGGALLANYDNSVWRGVGSSHGAQWDEGADSQSEHRSGWQTAQPTPAPKALVWDEAAHAAIAAGLSWGRARSNPVDDALAWDSAIQLPHEALAGWGNARSSPQDRRTPWQTAPTPKIIYTRTPYVYGTPRHVKRDVIWDNSPNPLHKSWLSRFDQRAQVRNLDRVAPWDQARPVASWGSVWVHPTTPVTPYEPPSRDLVLGCMFDATGGVHLIIGGGPCSIYVPPPSTETVVVPIRRVYMLINSASLRRVEGSIALPTFEMSLSLDTDSWTWGFSASLPGSTLSDLEPASSGAPVEVEALINGVAYRALVESISRSREFGRNELRVQGRGKTALLDSPYAPAQSFDNNTAARTAQQLMGDVLSIGGVPIGWSVDWSLTDWLVPQGVFNHQGTYVSALNAIAGAAGGYVQPHASTQTVRVLSRYPSAPWDWAGVTPDYELPAAVTVREGIEWAERARYNRVFVSGVREGIVGQVTRTGSAGDLLAPMVTDPLITHADAARQRGRVILSNTGRVANVSLRLPVLPATGIITPGKFVRYTDGATTRLGIVRSVGVSVSMPEIWQTLGVETHV